MPETKEQISMLERLYKHAGNKKKNIEKENKK